jgi:hypothetical protein
VHPYINKLIADERGAEMRADAAAYRLAREAKASKRKSAERRAARRQAPGQPVPAQRDGYSSSRPAGGHSSRQDDDRLVGAGRTGGGQRK